MTREIDPDRIEAGDLSFAEAEYLRVRGLLPEGYEMPEDDTEAGEDESGPVPSRVTPLEEQSVPVMGNRGGIVDEDEEDEDYEAGWNNDSRRAELSRRGLSVDGGKNELIARLRRSDADTLDPNDVAD